VEDGGWINKMIHEENSKAERLIWNYCKAHKEITFKEIEEIYSFCSLLDDLFGADK
jgi:hypothetical protein